MAAVTHAAFRTLVEELSLGSCDEYYSEMIGAGAFVSGGQYEKWYTIADPAPKKMVWQVVGGNEDYLRRAAAALAQLDGIGVDINMGCSAPDILRAGAGAAWLDRDIKEVQKMVRAVRRAVKETDASKRLSVKMRLAGKRAKDGWLEDTVKMLCNEGVERIAIHARGEGEKYRTPARYEAVQNAAAIASSFGVSFAINGDIKDAKSMQKAIALCPAADCIMVARQAAVTPWVFALLKAELEGKPRPLVIDREQAALDFVRLLKEYQPKDFWRTRLKRFFAYYAQGFSFAHYFATQMTNCNSTDEAEARIKDYFVRQTADKQLVIK